jgi:hypothetical protein
MIEVVKFSVDEHKRSILHANDLRRIANRQE